MDLVVTAVNAAVMGAIGLALWWAFKGRFEALEKRMDRLEDRVDQRMDTFQSSLDGMRESFQSSLDGMRESFQSSLDGMRESFQSSLDGTRSDITAIALAVGARLRAQNG